jgi:large subunit ribosomal protein L21
MTTTTKKEEKTTSKAAKTAKNSKMAVIKTGGKQYLVAEGDVVKIEKLADFDAEKSKGKIVFDEVLMIVDGDNVDLGTPTVKSKVEAELVEEGRDKKITVIKFKSKSRYFRKSGHRQPFIRARITKIA